MTTASIQKVYKKVQNHSVFTKDDYNILSRLLEKEIEKDNARSLINQKLEDAENSGNPNELYMSDIIEKAKERRSLKLNMA